MTIDDCRKSTLHCEDLAAHYAGTELGAHYRKLAEQWLEVVKGMEKQPQWHREG
jgi:hypothetical protein